MSADNGTYILKTAGPEFRVAHIQGLDSIYDAWDAEHNKWLPNKAYIKSEFGNAKVHGSVESAWDAARLIDDGYEISEYGVCLLTDFSDTEFSLLIDVVDPVKVNDENQTNQA